MRRRALLAALAAMIAGCSDAHRGEEAIEETVTPVPVPDDPDRSGITDDGDVAAKQMVDTHVTAIAERGASASVEYDLRSDDTQRELVRIVWTTDGDGAFSYRYYELNPPPLEVFLGVWYGGNEAVVREQPPAGRSFYVSEDSILPSQRRRADGDRLEAMLRAFDPDARSESNGYRLSAEGIEAAGYLVSEMRMEEATRLSGSVAEMGYIERLTARFDGWIDDEPVTGKYAIAVTNVNETAVERPTREETREWVRELREESPIPES